MTTAFIILSYCFAFVSFLPAFRVTHWSFRIFDFIRIPIILIQIGLFISGFFVHQPGEPLLIWSQLALLVAIMYQTFIILPFFPVRQWFKKEKTTSSAITVLSVNVLQKNNHYQKLIDLIEKVNPDIILTMETNKDWENALVYIEKEYPNNFKIPIENRYGMHFYTKLKVNEIKDHYFISEDRPAIEAHLVDKNDTNFVFWGIHPPPPSPTEMPTSKQKDGALMKAAKLIRKKDEPSIVTGDFNNVCWSRSAKLFSKVSGLKDARLQNGIHGTFPANIPFFRFPLDLVYSSKEIEIQKIKVLENIESDHLPIFVTFNVKSSTTKENDELDDELEEKADEMIKEGHKAARKEE